MDPITIASLAMGGVQVAKGLMQGFKGGQLAKENVRPVYEIPEGYKQNLRMYQSLAQSGIGEDAFSHANNKALQGLTASLQTGLITGGDPNAVGDYYYQYLTGMNDLFVKDASQKMQNIANLAKARNDYSEQEQVAFGYNKDAPYKDKAQLASQMKTDGMKEVFGGINTGMNAWGQQQQRDLYKDYLGKAGTAGTAVAAPPGLPATGGTTGPDMNDPQMQMIMKILPYLKF